jgi:hypothetical protein
MEIVEVMRPELPAPATESDGQYPILRSDGLRD